MERGGDSKRATEEGREIGSMKGIQGGRRDSEETARRAKEEDRKDRGRKQGRRC